MAEMIMGRNACIEALQTDRQVEKLYVLRSAEDGQRDGRAKAGRKGDRAKAGGRGERASAGRDGALQKILAKAQAEHIPVSYVDRAALDRMAGGGVHQGVIASVAAYDYRSVEELLQIAADRNEPPFLILLDGLEDPHNLGAIMRTAECAGAHGIIIPERRSVSVNATVMKTSAGAAEHIGCARVKNMGRTVQQLKEQGVWIYGCDMDGEDVFGTDLTGPAAIVIGNEGRGISRLVREACDFIISIPMRGRINSLNASNAAAIVTYEALRQRREGFRR